jgi:hypothetical protein
MTDRSRESGAGNDAAWSDQDKQRWLATQGGAPTHVLTFEPIYQIEVCIPPWERTDRQLARAAVDWGRNIRHVFDHDLPDGIVVVAAHHEGNSLEVHRAIRPQPHLYRLT